MQPTRARFVFPALGLAMTVACGGAPATAPARGGAPAAIVDEPGPRFAADGALAAPTDYRGWVFLTSGFAMSYGPAAQAAAAGGVDVLDNVYVAPAAYRGFLATGVWPEHTMFVLEIRTAEVTGSIVTRGRYQTDLVGIEAAVKDSVRFPDGWAYFDFASDGHGPSAPAQALPATAACYGCHRANGAVEQTFTQFYPTLFEVARAKGTVRADFAGIPPGAGDLLGAYHRGGGAAAATLLTATARRWPDATVLREATLNQLAYRLLADHQTDDALALFDDITRRFPASSNAWDSLSEAHEGAGHHDLALAATDRGLAALDADPAMTPQRRPLIERSLRERRTRLAP